MWHTWGIGEPRSVVVRPLGRMRHRWEYNVKVGLNEMVSEGVDWG
jgi:hypothetical protein